MTFMVPYVIAFMEERYFLKSMNLFYLPRLWINHLMYFSHEMEGFLNNMKMKIKYCWMSGY